MNQENQNIEYKVTWRDEYLKWICGFANAQGGTLYIGIDDDGNIVGVENARRLAEDIPNKIATNLGIVCDINVLSKDNFLYLEIIVEQSNIPISYHGVYHYRSGSTKQELKGIALQQFLLNKLGRRWDDAICEQATTEDIDNEAIAYFIDKGIKSSRIDKDEKDSSATDILKSLNLIDEKGHIKNAAILLFGKNPAKYFNSIQFKIGKFGLDEADLMTQDVIEGNIIEMADKVMKTLKAYYLKSFIHYEGMQRQEVFELPEEALREIIYNAIVHKDYTGAAIQMHIYDDRIEIWNDGELPEGYTQDVLMQRHSSKPRNKNIANAFFKAGFIEAWGRGFKKIFEGFKNAGIPIPEISNHCGGTNIVIQRPVQELTDVDKNVGKDVGKDILSQITDRQQIIIGLLSLLPTLTAQDLSVKMSVNKRTIERDIAILQNIGIIIREGGRKNGAWKIKLQTKN